MVIHFYLFLDTQVCKKNDTVCKKMTPVAKKMSPVAKKMTPVAKKKMTPLELKKFSIFLFE